MCQETDDNKTGKALGAIATGCYVGLWVLLLLFVNFDSVVEQKDEGGILIDFGQTELSGGTTDLSHVEPTVAAAVEPKVKAEQVVQTQDIEPAPEVVSNQTVEPEPEVEKPREVNKRALFKGATAKSPSTSEGESTGKGNQGHEQGASGGEKEGTGQGDSGQSFDLRGRNLIGELPRPDYAANELGQVIVRIVVSSRGIVTSAVFQPVGSTIQNQTLVNAAISAAHKAKFNPTEDLTPQQGTITYIFKMQ